MGDLETYRKRINEIDAQMAGLFEERMQVSREIAAYKKEFALPIKDPGREAQVTAKGRERIKDPEIEPYYVGFQQKVIELSCDLQERLMEGMRVGYSGVEGAYAYIAAKRMYPGAKLISYSNFEPAYRAAEAGEVDCIVLPLENSYAGEVGAVMDLAFSGSLFINRVVGFEIEHNLLAVEGASMSTIRTVVSHPQALMQCDEFIRSHGFESIQYSNTALAAKFVREQNDPSIAAIASEDTAEIFGLKVLESRINTTRNNSSRFGVFSRALAREMKPDRTRKDNFILVFTVRNEAGALAMALDIIGAHGFNMKNLKSRPMKGLMWNYYFYIEAEGSVDSEDGRDMLRELAVICDKLKLLGKYSESIE